MSRFYNAEYSNSPGLWVIFVPRSLISNGGDHHQLLNILHNLALDLLVFSERRAPRLITPRSNSRCRGPKLQTLSEFLLMKSSSTICLVLLQCMPKPIKNQFKSMLLMPNASTAHMMFKTTLACLQTKRQMSESKAALLQCRVLNQSWAPSDFHPSIFDIQR